jgi:hypothetical protein
MDSNPPSDSPKSTKPDSSSWREESNFLSKESSNEQPPSLEPATETSFDPEELALLIPVNLVNEYQVEASLRAINEHQKRKFSRLRKRVRDMDLKYDRLWENHLAYVRLTEAEKEKLKCCKHRYFDQYDAVMIQFTFLLSIAGLVMSLRTMFF